MTHFKNYNNTVDTLKQLGSNQYQIKTVTTGDIYEIDLEKNTLYPLMHINPTSVQANESSLRFNFQIFIMDLVSIKDDWTTSTAVNKTNENVTIQYNKSNVIFSFSNMDIYCRLIDGSYPNYHAVIPKDSPNTLNIERLSLLNSLKRVAIFSNQSTNQIKFEIKGIGCLIYHSKLFLD